MDIVDLVLVLLGGFSLSTIALTALAMRLWYGKRAAQAEVARLVAQSRPRSPQHSAGYDTGLVEFKA